VHLSERRRSHRVLVEVVEDPRQPHTQLVLDRLADGLERERLECVLEAGERFEVRRREQVGARGQQLAELDEGGTHPLQVGGELVTLRVGLRGHGLVGQHGVEAGLAHQIGAAVLDQKPRKVAVATEALRRGQEIHIRGIPPGEGSSRL